MIDFNNKKVLFLGDSITQCGLYIAYLNAYIYLNCQGISIDTVNLGKSSETASGLSEPDHPFPRPCIFERLDSALLKTKPDITFICYGMNDGIYCPLSQERFDAYKNGMNRLIERIKGEGSQVIVLTPPPFDAYSFLKHTPVLLPDNMEKYSYMEPYEDYNKVIKAYSKWVLALTDIVDAIVDIHTALSENISQMRKNDKDYISGDGIHPNNMGHWIITKAILKELFNIKAENIPEYVEGNSTWSDSLIKWHEMHSSAWREYVESNVKPPVLFDEANALAKQIFS